MEVLHVITGLERGGAEGVLLRLAGSAPGQHEVAVLRPGIGLRGHFHAAGVKVHELAIGGAAQALPGLWRLARLIRQLRPQIVQGWLYHGDLFATAALALSRRRKATRLVWSVRASDMDAARYARLHRIGAWASRFPDLVTYNSAAGRRFHERVGYRPRASALVDNGIDISRFHQDPEVGSRLRATLQIPDEATVAIALGRNDPMKNWPGLLAAVRDVPGLTLLAAGTGTEALPNQPGLVRLGARDDVAALLAASDLFVLASSHGEGFSNALGEAMASALPCIATDVGDAARVLGGTGLVVPPGDASALRAALAALSADPARRRALGSAARDRIATHFTVQHMLDRFDALYADLITHTLHLRPPVHPGDP
ncbi:glycosyltransferase [Zavarzinia sp. CC-PAN008]|uniref:glycosyltransferase n=1 Tax=Zavarzinia sp. CC-PAN008 TaxID=3243332 RepID=UPI003F7491EB